MFGWPSSLDIFEIDPSNGERYFAGVQIFAAVVVAFTYAACPTDNHSLIMHAIVVASLFDDIPNYLILREYMRYENTPVILNRGAPTPLLVVVSALVNYLDI
jgi:hypothetical protein